MKSAVPGLARGIEILRRLEDGGERTLEELARLTRFPKSSLLRVLETLDALGLAARSEATKRYYATQRLIPLRHVTEDFANALSTTLTEISSALGFTAEWWEPAPSGMVLVRRSEPDLGGARVIARVGYTRPWNEELDAVACVGLAWFDGAPKPARARMFAYADDGARQFLSRNEIKARVAAARHEGHAFDAHYNSNGVRRMACAVLNGDALAGALAVAACYRPKADAESRANLRFLLEKASRLFHNSDFRLPHLLESKARRPPARVLTIRRPL